MAGPGIGRAGKGRPKGVQNKFTVAFKEMLLEVVELRGGVPALLEWSNQDPTSFYALCSKLIPKQVEVGGGGQPIKVTIVTGVPESTVKPDDGRTAD